METLDTTILTDELLESDYRYFESNATLEHFKGATIVRMQGLEALAAACIVQRLELQVIGENADQWLESLEKRFIDCGYGYVRFYLPETLPKLEAALRQRRYKSRFEHGYLRFCGKGDETNINTLISDVVLQPIINERHWKLKLQLHNACQKFPDGHEARPDLWVGMERRKVEAGYMQPYLIKRRNQVCGAVSAAPGPRLLRLKNLVIHPEVRGQSIGRQAVNGIIQLAYQHGKVAVSLFALEGSAGASLYQSCGFRPVVCQQEWFKPI